MSTALQNIERQKGRREERREIMRQVRVWLKLYPGDRVLRAVLEDLKERQAND
jgi:hypothetical protein